MWDETVDSVVERFFIDDCASEVSEASLLLRPLMEVIVVNISLVMVVKFEETEML